MGGMLSDQVFRSEVDGFEIKSPTGWFVDDSGKTGSSVTFLSPEPESINKNTYATFVSVTVGKTGVVDLISQVEIVKKTIMESYPTYQIEDDKEMYFQGRKYYLLGGYYIIDGIKIRNRNMITIYNGKGYAIWATCPDESWVKNELVILMSMNSFRLF